MGLCMASTMGGLGQRVQHNFAGILAPLGTYSGSLQGDRYLGFFCGSWLHQREQPKRSRGSWVAFSDTGPELSQHHFWPWIQEGGEFNVTSSARAQCRRACGVGYTAAATTGEPCS